MAYSNPKNSGTVFGRVTRKPQIFNNSDGSSKVKFTVAAAHNYKTGGQYGTDFVGVQAYIPANRDSLLKVYEELEEGQMVMIGYSLKTNSYPKNGKTIYELVAQINTIDTQIEPKSVRESRQLAKAFNAVEEADAADAPAEPEAEVTPDAVAKDAAENPYV